MLATFIHEKMHLEKKAVHGDIKVDNVIFQTSEKKVCVIDFGLTEHIDTKIGQYEAPKGLDAVSGKIKKLSPTEHCPQTPPELFGKEMIPAEPSQDAYGLGYFILSLLSKIPNISSEQKIKLRFVSAHLRAACPQERWPIPAAISKLHADFIVVVPRLISNSVESSLIKLGLFRQRRIAPYQNANPRAVHESVSLPLLTKAIANNQFRLTTHQVDSDNAHTESNVIKFPPVLSALAAPAASSSEEEIKEQVASKEGPGSKRIDGPWGYLFSLHAVSKPAPGPDPHP